ncbi:MAG: chorismate synthase [Acidobacteria bacterium]|nr:chorismate synthase [Acidobacteriota bacterium]
MRFLTAGESHGRRLTVILDGVPAGLALDVPAITRDLRRRQGGYGRGTRMDIESDTPVVVAGVRHGQTTGAPVAITIDNHDWVNWEFTMHPDAEVPPQAGGARRAPVTRPRPGHADLAGALKYGHDDLRNVLERASARETASRVAAGAVARQILAEIGVRIASHVVSIGAVAVAPGSALSFDTIAALPDDSPTRCADPLIEARMIAAIDAARAAGDTLGGAFEVVATGVPPGLGSYSQWDLKLDGRLAQAMMSIPAIKAVGIGIGSDAAHLPGSRVHDEILPGSPARSGAGPKLFVRPSNHAGGLEGGVTNGEDVRVTAYMKPIATLMSPLRSVDLMTRRVEAAAIERSDVCAVPAAAVVGEAMMALSLCDAVLDRFGGDSIDDLRRRHADWLARSAARFAQDGGARSV